MLYLYDMAKTKKGDKSLKTFFLYAFLVFAIIIISLSIKAFFVLRQSRFDGRSINIAISKNNKITAIFGYNAASNSTSILRIKNGNISVSEVGKKMGIIVDAKIDSEKDLTNESIDTILVKAGLKIGGVKSELTIIDAARIILATKGARDSDKKVSEIKYPFSEYEIDKIINDLFKNYEIATDNTSIEITNSTDEPGLGKRLERSLVNIGANVVSVSTSRETSKISKIKYYGSSNYTAQKLKKLLKYSVEKTNSKSVADIIIIIGEDSQNTPVF